MAHSDSWCKLNEKLKSQGYPADSAAAIATKAMGESVAMTEAQSDHFCKLLESLPTTEAALGAWNEIYEPQDGQWAKRKREQAESMEYAETLGYIQDVMEKGVDGLPSKARVVIIQSGPTKTKKRNYPAPALKALVESKMLDGLKQYDSHPPGSEVIPGATQAPRTIREYLSYIIPGTVQWCENIKLQTGEIVQGVTALAKLVDKGFKEKIAEAAETIGVSLNCLWDARTIDGIQTALRPLKAISADWVTDPNAGGLVLELVEAADPASITPGKEGTKMAVLENWADLTPEMVKANCPQIMSWIAQDVKDTQAKAEQIVEQAKQSIDTAKEETAKAQAESKAAKEKLAATEKEWAEFKTASAASAFKLKTIETVEAQAQAKGLNVLGQAEVMKNIMAKQFANETEMAEAVTAEIAKVPGAKAQPGSAPAKKEGEEKPSLTGRVAEMAENMGYTPEEMERLAKVR